MEPREAPGPVASVVAVLTVGFAAGWVTRQLRSRLRLPFWVAPIVGITVAGVLHSQLDEPVANLLARRRR
jgi:hypothetical protein